MRPYLFKIIQSIIILFRKVIKIESIYISYLTLDTNMAL